MLKILEDTAQNLVARATRASESLDCCVRLSQHLTVNIYVEIYV